MPTEIPFTLNGNAAAGIAGSSVAVAVMGNGITTFRRSVTGHARAPVCGMGICFECRLTIDGQPHQKSCQIVLAPHMVVTTDE
jgi:aerobic-type carbon monoxide dehydrogenase small subunit (CoxS/CutS family)